jgi:hypothetical protein
VPLPVVISMPEDISGAMHIDLTPIVPGSQDLHVKHNPDNIKKWTKV